MDNTNYVAEVERIVSGRELALRSLVDIYGVPHRINSCGEYKPVPDPNKGPEQINVTGLKSFCDAIKNVSAGRYVEAVVINNPSSVVAVSETHHMTGARDVVFSTGIGHSRDVEEYMDIYKSITSQKSSAEFCMMLLSAFVIDKNLENFVEICLGLKFDEFKKSGGDLKETGMEQRQTVYSTKGEVPEVVTLRPFITFSEIAQPEMMFVFKTEGVSGSCVKCQLVHSGAHLWKAKVAENIKAYIKDQGLTLPVV